MQHSPLNPSSRQSQSVVKTTPTLTFSSRATTKDSVRNTRTRDNAGRCSLLCGGVRLGRDLDLWRVRMLVTAAAAKFVVQLFLDVVERIDTQVVDLTAFPVVLTLTVVELLLCEET